MLANVRRGDVLVSSSDDESDEMKTTEIKVAKNVSPNRLRELVSELSESPSPVSDTTFRIFQITAIMEKLIRKNLRIGWFAHKKFPFSKLRQLFGFQLLTSTLKSNEMRLLSSAFLAFARTGRYSRSIKAS